ncbi:hypothetical protein BU16DRAFT_579773 [Lophium mytilinum]|uniref:Something about silencing protein 4 domain-containing protein n=1 Tax=Lophium mytilinum TaxID=390894 RepID=A0A6A6R1P1_9PEZI|nr:hypothetical protein BU16DRAFT_579773 [Lophium mytilinum]
MTDESRSSRRVANSAPKPPAPDSHAPTPLSTSTSTTTTAPRRPPKGKTQRTLEETLAPRASNTVAQVLIPTRNNARKRPQPSLDAPAGRSKPPTKVSVAQPHTGLLQTTNGVQTVLPLRDDDIHSGRSTPQTNGEGSLLAVPSTSRNKQDKRTLRSQDGGSRLKSDLSIYFPNYDDIIADAPKQPEFLEPDSPIYIVDEALKTPKARNASSTPAPRTSISPARSRKKSITSLPNGVAGAASSSKQPPDRTSTLYQVVDYTASDRHAPNDPAADPLADTHFFTAHRRAERKEKQLRNIEKERAMHEKVQLERLLEGLQGPDWLKVMGITGVTDGERKDWEPKRDYFVAEVKALVDKFRIWKEEEKRLKAEREAALLAREEEEEANSNEDGDSPIESAAVPNSSDVDAWAALQLQTEAAATASSSQPPTKRSRRPAHQNSSLLLPPPPLEPPKPFTSFYAKPHLREAAMGKSRHGRNVTAFGQPLPEPQEEEFALPPDYLTEEALRAHARKRRRVRRDRDSVGGSASTPVGKGKEKASDGKGGG